MPTMKDIIDEIIAALDLFESYPELTEYRFELPHETGHRDLAWIEYV